MITGNVARPMLRRKRKANLKLRRNFFGSGQGDEQAVEVAAVAIAALARPYGVALAPTGSLLAIAHVPIHDIIEDPRGSKLVLGQFLVLDEIQRFAADRNFGVGLQV